MKIVLLGKNGQIGHELQRTLLPLGQVIALGREEADLSNRTQLQGVLARYTPNIIVNAAAYTAVDKAENDEATGLSYQRRSRWTDGRARQAERRALGALLHRLRFRWRNH